MTHWRNGTSGNTSSASRAAVSAMRRAPQLGQNPRRLQLKARGRLGESLEVTAVATNPQKSMFKPAALQIVVEFPVDMFRQAFALLGQLVDQGRVVRFNNLEEQCLLGSVTFVGCVTNGILAMRQHTDRAATARLLR